MQTVASVFGLWPLRIGGIERFCRQLSLMLGEAGYRSLLVFSGEPVDAVREYLTLPNTDIRVLPGFGRTWAGCGGRGWKVLAEERPALVHLHFASLTGPMSWMARWQGARVFFTLHDSFPEQEEVPTATAWKQAVYRAMVQPVERLFCVSEFSANRLRRTGWTDPERVSTLLNAVPLPDLSKAADARRRFRARYGIGQNAPVVLHLSYLIAEKGVSDLLQAAPQILRSHPNTRFVIVGDGPARADLQREAESLGVAGATVWTGHDLNPSESGAFAAADLFCAASRWQEAFGYSIAESMSFGLPVVATRVGGIPEVVTDGVTGLLVPPRSPQEIAASVDVLLRSPEMRSHMGSRGRRKVMECFAPERACLSLLRAYGIPVAAPPPAVMSARAASAGV